MKRESEPGSEPKAKHARRAGHPAPYGPDGLSREGLQDQFPGKDSVPIKNDPGENVEEDELDLPEFCGRTELTQQELAERRLGRVEKLLKTYEDEYWHLMEELRHRHCQYAAKHGQSGFKTKRPATRPAGKVKDIWASQHKASELPSFSDCEEEVLSMDPSERPDDLSLQKMAADWDSKVGVISRLEQSAGASTSRVMDRCNAIACFVGRRARYFVRQTAILIGRGSKSAPADLDLRLEGDARHISREQAHVALGPSGDFAIRNVGRQSLHVNGQEVGPGQEVPLPHLGLVEIGDLHLLFMANHGAVQRALKLSVPESARDKAAKGTPGR